MLWRSTGDSLSFPGSDPPSSASNSRAAGVFKKPPRDLSMSAAKHYQAVVIGSGQGGTPLCRALAEAGLPTALIEREHIGGTCVNEGCTPTKSMVASGRVAYLARRSVDYGVHTGSIRVDMERVRERKRHI